MPFLDETGLSYVWTKIKNILNEKKSTKTVRYVIGTSTNGWTEADCDYLCDGVDDQVEINAAIQALPDTGGEIKILDGTYNISSSVSLGYNVKIIGNGISTILSRSWNSDGSESTMGILSAFDNCYIDNIKFVGNQNIYTSSGNRSVDIYGSYNTVANCVFINAYCGIYAMGNNNKVNKNNISSCDTGSELHGSYFLVTENNVETSNSHAFNFNISYSSISNNLIINNSRGIFLLGGLYNSISGNNISSNDEGLYLQSSKFNVISDNNIYNNETGLFGISSESNMITDNKMFRGSGLPSDYSSSQYTIRLFMSCTKNTIFNNIINGKDVADESGETDNLIFSNIWDDTIDVVTKDYVDTQLINKVNTEDGKGLSTNDYTNDEKTKLAGIAAGAQVNTIEQISVNGSPLSVSSKQVDITVPTILTFTATIPASGWEIYPFSLDGEPFTYWCKLDLNGVLSSDNCHIIPQYSTLSLLDVPDMQTAYSLIKLAMTENNLIRFYSDEIPSVDIPILIEVIR